MDEGLPFLSASSAFASGKSVQMPIGDGVTPSIPSASAIPPVGNPTLPAPTPIGTTSLRPGAAGLTRVGSNGATVAVRPAAGSAAPISSSPSPSGTAPSSQTSASGSAATATPSMGEVARSAAKQGAIFTFIISAVLNLFDWINDKKSWKEAIAHTLVDTVVGGLGAAGGAVLAMTLFGGTTMLAGPVGLVIGMVAGWFVTGLVKKLFGALFGTKDDFEKVEKKEGDTKKKAEDDALRRHNLEAERQNRLMMHMYLMRELEGSSHPPVTQHVPGGGVSQGPVPSTALTPGVAPTAAPVSSTGDGTKNKKKSAEQEKKEAEANEKYYEAMRKQSEALGRENDALFAELQRRKQSAYMRQQGATASTMGAR